MKVLLISLENTLVAFGIRYIAAMLKKAGFDTSILFLVREHHDMESELELDEIAGWIREQKPGLIGVSLMSSHVPRGVAITRRIKEVNHAPIVWGGVHATSFPEVSMEHVDINCVLEGELPMVELAEAIRDGKDYRKIPNLWVRKDGVIHKNEPRDRIGNLDIFEFPDYDYRDHFIQIRGKIVPMSLEIMERTYPGTVRLHYVISSRGCPYSCTYCLNSFFNSLAGGRYLRERSAENFITELEDIKHRLPFVEAFVFMDDSFLFHKKEWMVRFAEEYKKRVNMPFFCWSNPNSIKEDKLALLVDAGLVGIHLGLETGSDRIARHIYNRHSSRKKFLKVMEIIDRYRDRILDLRLDIITDCPWESEEDTQQTIDLVTKVKKPYFLGITHLMFYPATQLEKRARQEGIPQERLNEVFTREFWCYEPNYLNRILRIIPRTPYFLIRFWNANPRSRFRKASFYLYYYTVYAAYWKLVRPMRHRWIYFVLRRFKNRLSPARRAALQVQRVDFGG